MKNKDLYYYKCGIGIGICDKEGKERVDAFLKNNNKLRKKTRWISKQEYFIRSCIYIIVGYSLVPFYVITYYLGNGFSWIANKIYNFICNKLRV